MSTEERPNNSVWLTLLGTMFALLVCLSATGMVYLVYPQSGNFLRFLFDNPAVLDSNSSSEMAFLIEPTPFQPLPTAEPTFTPTLPAIPTATATPLPTQTPPPPPEPAAATGKPPSSAYVDYLYGSPQLYTLDCESQAAVDWARFFGGRINEREFIDRLPTSDDPEEGFVGNINGPMGQIPPGDYGVYQEPVASLLREYGLNAAGVKGWTLDALKHEIAAGRPVIVWIVNLPFAVNPSEFTASNGNTTIVAPFQHTWIVTGYNSASFTIVDSEWTYNVLTKTFIERWNVLGNRAVVLVPSKNS